MTDTPIEKREGDDDVVTTTTTPILANAESTETTTTKETVINENNDDENENSAEDPNDYLRIRNGDRLGSTAKRQRLLKKEQNTWVCFFK